jgi:hypothetical protein
MSRSRGLANEKRGQQLDLWVWSSLQWGVETLPSNPAQQLSMLVIIIYSSSKTATETLSIFKNLSKADIWSIRTTIKELYSYAYGVSFKL